MQTNYNLYPDKAFAGMKGTSEVSNVITKASNGVIPFGMGVAMSLTNSDVVEVPTSTSQKFMGIAVHQHNENGTGYSKNDAVGILRKGTIYGIVSSSVATVADGDKAYCVMSGAEAGKLTDVEADGKYVGAFRENGEADKIVEVEVALPVHN